MTPQECAREARPRNTGQTTALQRLGRLLAPRVGSPGRRAGKRSQAVESPIPWTFRGARRRELWALEGAGGRAGAVSALSDERHDPRRPELSRPQAAEVDPAREAVRLPRDGVPAGLAPCTSCATPRPATSWMDRSTFPTRGRTYVRLVAPAKGFGVFCSKAKPGTASAAASVPVTPGPPPAAGASSWRRPRRSSSVW
jgi:hypothetical protein